MSFSLRSTLSCRLQAEKEIEKLCDNYAKNVNHFIHIRNQNACISANTKAGPKQGL